MRNASLLLVFVVLTGCTRNLPQRDPAGRPAVHVDLTVQGKQLAEAGDYVRAEQYLAGALEAGGDVDAVLPVLLRVCVASERYEAALAYAERYEPLARNSAQLELVLAALQLSVGQVDAARRSLEAVLAQEENPQAHYMLGDLYYHTLQDFSAADNHFRQYLALAPDGPHAANVRRLLLKSPHQTFSSEKSELDAPAKSVTMPEEELDDSFDARPQPMPREPESVLEAAP
jgi:tetratricopeptide (TPR) repeat protein